MWDRVGLKSKDCVKRFENVGCSRRTDSLNDESGETNTKIACRKKIKGIYANMQGTITRSNGSFGSRTLHAVGMRRSG